MKSKLCALTGLVAWVVVSLPAPADVPARLAAAAATPPPANTRKIVLDKTGSGYRWKMVEAPVSRIADHQVLIHVRALSLNRGDLEILETTQGPDLSGRVVGSDAAGDVLAVGKDVTGVRPGMRVSSTYFRNYVDGLPDRDKLSGSLGAAVDGVAAEYLVLDDTTVVPVAEGLTYEEAAALPTAGLTGWMATAGQRTFGKEDIVLVQGTGGVSLFALQFASAAGAHVIVTSSSDEKLTQARKYGAADGINYRTTPQWANKTMELTHGHGADLVVDVGGKDTLEQSVRALAVHGTVAIVGGLSGYDGRLPAGALIGKVARAQGVFVGSSADFKRMNAFIVAHHLHPVIDKVYPLSDFQAALEQMKSGNFMGKIVLRP